VSQAKPKFPLPKPRQGAGPCKSSGLRDQQSREHKGAFYFRDPYPYIDKIRVIRIFGRVSILAIRKNRTSQQTQKTSLKKEPPKTCTAGPHRPMAAGPIFWGGGGFDHTSLVKNPFRDLGSTNVPSSRPFETLGLHKSPSHPSRNLDRNNLVSFGPYDETSVEPQR